MISLFILAAIPTLGCEHLKEPEATRCGLAVQQFICWTTESRNISPHDPALLIFWEKGEGEKLKDAMVDLAIERVNSCDPTPEGER